MLCCCAVPAIFSASFCVFSASFVACSTACCTTLRSTFPMRDCSFATMFRMVDNDTLLPPDDCADFALSSPTFAGADAGGVLAGVDEVGVVEATTVVVGAVQQSVVRPSFSLTTNIDVRRNEEVELPKSEGIKFGDRNQAFNLIEEKPQTVQQTTTTTTTTTVNQKATENEAAAGVTLASIAMQPRGYESYFSTLPDAQFYAPKEIYRGQKTVDNARALRQLSTDRLHQEMVNQQFNGR